MTPDERKSLDERLGIRKVSRDEAQYNDGILPPNQADRMIAAAEEGQVLDDSTTFTEPKTDNLRSES